MLKPKAWTALGGLAVLAVVGLTGATPGTAAAPSVQTAAAVIDVPVANLSLVPGAIACADLVAHDFTGIPGAPTRIDTATVEPSAPGSAPQPFCDVKGHAGSVHFELKLPITGWTQRLLTVGCGGYCGVMSYSASTESDTGCPLVHSGELAVATTDLGHTANAFAADGLWGLNNPTAIIDFGYAGMHKTTLAAKAIIDTYYRQPPTYSYLVGCSNGGRESLMEAQRFPNDYDGIVAGSPTIDDAVENTFAHGWNVRANSTPDGHAILTADKIPALHAAVLAACANRDGGIGTYVTDPRGCHFNAGSLICPGADSPSCLTAAQAAAANRLWQGPVDENGRHLTVGGLPYGSELGWIGWMVLRPEQTFSFSTSVDYTYSYDWPNYLSRWSGPTGITNRNMRFTVAEFNYLLQTGPAIDSTNPDLSGFYRHGGKLIMWDGSADIGSSPFATLNYYDAVTRMLGAARTDRFVKLYLPPGEYHCGGGPAPAGADYLTPLMSWRELGAVPNKIVTTFTPTAGGAVARTEAVYPFPNIAVYTGRGDPNDQANWRESPPQHKYPRHYDWLGNFHYTPGYQKWYTPTVTVSTRP